MKTMVIDASVSIKWFLDDEEYVEKSLQILAKIQEGKMDIVLPELCIYEVTNGFNSAVLKKRIKIDQAIQFTKDMKDLEFPLMKLVFLLEEIIKIALKFHLSVYDASYVALANHKNCDFITGDKKLYHKLKNKLTFVKYLGNYE